MFIEFVLLFLCTCLFIYFAVDLHLDLFNKNFRRSILYYKLEGRTVLEWFIIIFVYYSAFYVAYCIDYWFTHSIMPIQFLVQQYSLVILGGFLGIIVATVLEPLGR
jgi:hypothetical protein